MNEGYNPEFNPTGIEGGIDTNALPWIELSQAPGMAIKPLRASIETGVFTVVVRLRKGTELSGLVYLGAMDMMVLAGTMSYPEGPMNGDLEPGATFLPMRVSIVSWHSKMSSFWRIFTGRSRFWKQTIKA